MTKFRLLPLLALVCSPLCAQSLPKTEFETLAGSKLTLPAAAAGKTALLIVGFTHASGKPTGEWGKELAPDCRSHPRLVCYQIAVLQDAPRMFRGMIAGGIKRGIPKDQQDSFLILVHDEDTWKSLAGFANPDDAYLLLVDDRANIHWKTHGPPTAAALKSLREQLP